MTDFLHGTEVIQIDNGIRPIETVKSSVIGIVGTAPNADEQAFPLNTPVLIAGNRREAAKLDTKPASWNGGLPCAVDAILSQIGALIIVVRVEFSTDDDELAANMIGGVDESGQYTGMQALLAAESKLGFAPRLIICPSMSKYKAVADAMVNVAERLRAVAFADGPNTTDAEAIAYREQFDSKRLMIVDPRVIIFCPSRQMIIHRPASIYYAAIQAKVDYESGFWHSVSNEPMSGVIDTSRSIDFANGDPNSRANLLNDREVSTIIRQNGFRTWGNRTTSSDPKWAFMTTTRVADMINDSVQRAHLWAVDRNITKTYLEDVVEGVKAYIRELVNLEAIIDGDAWVDPEINTQTTLAKGQVFIDFDFKEHPVAERITFRSHLNNGYLTQILPTI